MSTANYLLSLKTHTPEGTGQLLSTSQCKTFVIGFVARIKSTISMATEMFSLPTNPFKYLLTYKFSQDHVELLFSCIRSRGGWNNNPNVLQFKYAIRYYSIKMQLQHQNMPTVLILQDAMTLFPFSI